MSQLLAQTAQYLSHLPVTQLLQVRREGNPLRRYAHVSPFMGKLQPVDNLALDGIVNTAIAILPPLPGSTLVMGLAESSLLLAWWLARALPIANTDLSFTSRHSCFYANERSFLEPHSHAPTHFFCLPASRSYTQIIIVDDELTTGITVKHLIWALRDVTKHFYILTLSDLRSPEHKMQFDIACAEENLQIQLVDLSIYYPLPSPISRAATVPNPPTVRTLTDLQLQQRWNLHKPDTFYMVGECIAPILNFWQSLPISSRPALRHVTRSPWEIDQQVIFSRVCLTQGEVPYYLYNWDLPKPKRALIVNDKYTRASAIQLVEFLRENGITTDNIEVFVTC
ncbi:MAG: hypothetical protein BWK79_07900 [Beggiatoa sp. IS2]|nr:MAG: hypothetical protein BWK79_07900 [Beggiatoa sp. IS2]